MKALRIHALAAGLMVLTLSTSCGDKGTGMDKLPDISADIKKQLAFTCTHEKDRIPPRDPEADQLYKHARWLVKGNILKQDPAVYPSIERLVRIATAYGHDKANIELRGMLEKSQAVSPDPVNEVIDLVQDLIHRGIPAGYYDMGWYLAHGYGVRADQDLAFKYYRRSADLGSPHGQFLVGDLLANPAKHGMEVASVGLAMYRCAADQHHSKAANMLGVYLSSDGQGTEAMKYFQIATLEGMSVSASSLADAFSVRRHADPTWGLGQSADPERERRYSAMQDFLHRYDYLNARIPEINDIVPLPPAKLPAWDGKFNWLEEHEANIPPPLPTEQRIAEMARAKGLDPKTGRPLKAAK